jgi:hypothetical protein
MDSRKAHLRDAAREERRKATQTADPVQDASEYDDE